MKTILKALGKVKIVYWIVLVLIIFLIFNSYKHKSDYNRMFGNMKNELTDSLITIIKDNKAVVEVRPNYFTRSEAKELLHGEFEMLRKEFKMKAVDQITNVNATAETWTTGDLSLSTYDELNDLLKSYFTAYDTVITEWDYKDGFFTITGALTNQEIVQWIRYDLYLDIYKGKKRRWDKKGLLNKINLFSKRYPYAIFLSPDTTLRFNNINLKEIK